MGIFSRIMNRGRIGCFTFFRGLLLVSALGTGAAQAQVPVVTNMVPWRGTVGADRSGTVEVEFDQSMDGTTITSNRFFMYSDMGGTRKGSVLFNGLTNKVALVPTESLLPGERLHVDLARGIMNAGGADELVPYSWSFYAAANEASAKLGPSEQSFSRTSIYGITLADIDRDGVLELITGDLTSFQSRIYTNDGTGRFYAGTQQFGYNRDIAVGDLNGDGWQDLFCGGTTDSRVFTNNGSGVFSLSQYIANNWNERVLLADFDGDGDIDALALNRYDYGKVWTNDGTGWFGDTGQQISTGLMGGAVGDLDSDGDLDVVISSSAGVNIYTNDGTGLFGTVAQQLISASSYDCDIGDANGDGYLDVLVGRYGGDSRVFTNDGNGAFFATGQNLAGYNITGSRFGDMNGDDLLDVVLYGISFGKYVFTNNGSAMFYQHDRVSGGNGDGAIVLGDIDGDHDLDLAVGCISSPGVEIFFNEYPEIALLDASGTALPDDAPASVAHATDFEELPVGAVVTNVFNMTNSSGVELTISDASISGAGASSFAVVDMPGAVGDRTNVFFGIRFAPLATGLVTAQVILANNSTNTDYVVNVQGTGIAPTVTNTVPANAQDDVLTANITAEFDAAMKPATLSTDTYRLYSGQSGFLNGSVTMADDDWSTAFVPGQGFRPGELIYAEITHGVSNAAGSVELVPHAWMFYAMAAGCGEMSDGVQDPGTNDTRCAALGDLDGDGDLDAVFVNYEQPDEVWTNDGDGVFYDSGQRLGGVAQGRFGALGDLDDDGDLDLFVANRNQGDTVWTNNGAGVFFDSGQSLGSGNSRCISLGDLDGDGDLDAYDTVQLAGDVIWFNDGSGVFTNDGQSLSTAEGRGAMLGDINGDGTLDVCIAVKVAGDEVWTNDGHGVFYNTGQALGAGPGRDVALGDLNSDGSLDIFIAEDNATGNSVWTNDGQGVFYNSGQALGTSDSVAVELGDMDGDGDLDACVANNGQPDTFWENDGTGTFILEGETTNASASWHVALGDVNGDGSIDALVPVSGASFYLMVGDVPDLYVLGEDDSVIANNAQPSLTAGTDFGGVNQGFSKTLSLVFTNAGNGVLTVQSVYNMLPEHFTVETSAPFELYEDESTNVAIRFDADVPGVYTALVFFVNNSTNSPYWLNLVAECVPPGVTNTIPAANERHVDNDTYVIAQFNTNMMVSTITSNTFFLYGEQSGYHRGSIGAAYSGMEVILDPDTDLQAGERVFGEFTRGITNEAGTFDMAYHTWCFNVKTATGGGTMYPQQYGPHDSIANSLPLGDLNNDGWLDAIVSAYGGFCYVMLNDGTGFLTTNQSFGRWDYSDDMMLGDLDNDGYLDIFMVCDEHRGDQVWTNDGTGFFWDSGQVLGTNDNRAAALGDLDGDGDLDAFVVTENTKGNSVWFNDGLGTFTDGGQRFYGGDAYDVILADVDGDGDLDGFEVTHAANRVWFNDGHGFFTDSGQRLGDNYSGKADCGDINGDGYVDVITACGWDYFAIWNNDGHGVFTNSGQTLGSQYATDVGLGDLDGDGDLDVATVYLNNTASRVWYNDGHGVFTDSGQRLDQNDYRVSTGDFNNDGRLDLYMGGYNLAGQIWTNYAEVYAVEASCGPHGSIHPAGTVEVVVSQSISFVVFADEYCQIGTLMTNGVEVVEAAGAAAFTSRWVEVTQTGSIHAAITEQTAAEGTPLWWLASYGLTNGGASFDEAEVADVDTDEFDAADEYIADTNPNDSNSFFCVTAVSNTASCELFFNSSSNRNYSLFFSDQLNAELWSGVAGQTNQPGVGGPDSLIDTNEAGARSYRLSVELP